MAAALLTLLCACAGKAPDTAQQALTFRTQTLENDCAFQAAITASFDDCVAEFTLSCEHTARGGTAMTILSPETLEGITAQTDETGAKLVFEDAEASFGTLEVLGLSPMAAPQLITSAWESGYIAYTGTEDGLLRVTYTCGYGEDAYTVDTWFADGIPVHAEVSRAGKTAVQIDVTDYILRKAETYNEITQTNLGRYLAGQFGA